MNSASTSTPTRMNAQIVLFAAAQDTYLPCRRWSGPMTVSMPDCLDAVHVYRAALDILAGLPFGRGQVRRDRAGRSAGRRLRPSRRRRHILHAPRAARLRSSCGQSPEKSDCVIFSTLSTASRRARCGSLRARASRCATRFSGAGLQLGLELRDLFAGEEGEVFEERTTSLSSVLIQN